MKKLLLILAAVALFAACDKDPEGQTALEGKWTAHAGAHWDSHHPIDITFTGDKYVWHAGGFSPMKEEGTFTYENDIITLKGSAFWTGEVDWSQSEQGGAPTESSTWAKAELSFPNHQYKVLSIEADVMTVEQLTSDVIDQGTKMVWTRGNSYPEESTLQGTWEGTSESGTKYRIKFDGKNFTRWEVSQQWGKLEEGGEIVTFTVCFKESGTWKYASGELTLTPTQGWNSYIVHCDQYAAPLYYEYSPIDETTLEATVWHEIGAAALWGSTWGLIKVGKTIYVEVKYTNMDAFIIEQK